MNSLQAGIVGLPNVGKVSCLSLRHACMAEGRLHGQWVAIIGGMQSHALNAPMQSHACTQHPPVCPDLGAALHP